MVVSPELLIQGKQLFTTDSTELFRRNNSLQQIKTAINDITNNHRGCQGLNERVIIRNRDKIELWFLVSALLLGASYHVFIFKVSKE